MKLRAMGFTPAIFMTPQGLRSRKPFSASKTRPKWLLLCMNGSYVSIQIMSPSKYIPTLSTREASVV